MSNLSSINLDQTRAEVCAGRRVYTAPWGATPVVGNFSKKCVILLSTLFTYHGNLHCIEKPHRIYHEFVNLDVPHLTGDHIPRYIFLLEIVPSMLEFKNNIHCYSRQFRSDRESFGGTNVYLLKRTVYQRSISLLLVFRYNFSLPPYSFIFYHLSLAWHSLDCAFVNTYSMHTLVRKLLTYIFSVSCPISIDSFTIR